MLENDLYFTSFRATNIFTQKQNIVSHLHDLSHTYDLHMNKNIYLMGVFALYTIISIY